MTKDDKTAKDDPAAVAKPSPELNISKGKIKKNKKKKRHPNKSESSVSSSSASETDHVPPIGNLVIDEPVKEQFYDAHESYHGLPAGVENLISLPHLTVTPALSKVPARVTGPPAAAPNSQLAAPNSQLAAPNSKPAAPNSQPAAQNSQPAAPASVLVAAGLPVAPAAGTALLVAQSEHGHDPKISVPDSVTQTQPVVTRAKKKPSTITKPVTGPE